MEMRGESKTPNLATQGTVDTVKQELANAKDEKQQKMLTRLIAFFQREASEEIFLDRPSQDSIWASRSVQNLHVSDCFECHQLSVWHYDRLLFPNARTGPEPNADMPADIQRDFNEARTILSLSPRGACALLRLSIDKLVTEIGAVGADVNDRIAYLVANGLPAEIQQALDTVRVIGNEAVHPGALDLRDDPETATELFGLVNVIVDDRISRPKRISAIYAKVPESKRKAIDKRDGRG